MAETLVKCPCGSDMGETQYKGLQTCPHCDGVICPNFKLKRLSLTANGCVPCANLIQSLDA